jgi:hypothetical protein
VTVSIVVANKAIFDIKDLNEKVGRPKAPVFSSPIMVYCDPSPTNVPEIMSLSVDIFCRYISSS